MSKLCKFMKITVNNDGSEVWTCYKQFEKRGLIQPCFLKKGECRYTSGPFKPEVEGKALEEAENTVRK